MSQYLNILVIPGSSPFQLLFITEKYFCLAHLNRKILFSWVCLKKGKKQRSCPSVLNPHLSTTKEILQKAPKDLEKNWRLIIIVQHKTANHPVSEEQMGYIK